jgi:hypothetical protein
MNLFDQLANTNLAEVSTAYPVLTGGVYEFAIKTFEKKTSDRTGGDYLAIGVTLLSPDATDINGNSVSPGYAMRHMISLTPSAKQLESKTEEECNKDAIASLCKFLDALMTERVWDETLESYIGLTFFAKTKVGKERTDPNTGDVYAAQSEFAAFIPKQG